MTTPIDPNPSGFADASRALQQARRAAEQGRMAAFLAREKLRRVAAEQERLERAYDERSEAHRARRKALAEARAAAEVEIKRQDAAYGPLKEAVRAKFGEFSAFSDPRDGVTGLSDTIPFLLLPLRIETRFKILGQGPAARHQLWVRVYPDDLAVDTFEPVLADGEIKNAQTYWIDLWRAERDTGRQRAAWRSLAASHGSGRAAWILANYGPVNPGDKPVKAAPADVALIIPVQTPLPAAELPTVAAYWTAFWRANGEPGAEAAALAALEAAVGAPRAAEIIAAYRPANLQETPASPAMRVGVGVSVTVLLFPAPGALPTQRDSWSQPARVRVMPDRLVLLGYVSGNLTLERLGNPIPSPLAVGPDPTAPEGQELRAENGEIVFGDELAWMVDFERAVHDGMGFVVDLTPEEHRRGYDRLMVLGVRLAPDGSDGQDLLEKLLSHHQTSRTGFELLPQGTPTNNTEEKTAGFTPVDDPDASYDDLGNPNPLFANISDWMAKQDGQWLAEWLGIDPAVVAKAPHSGGKDQIEARAMNVALWPATLGYFMESMMGPVFDEGTIEEARWFFDHFVSGCGLVPAVRIGKQPYGILPASAFSRLRWPYQDGWGAFEPLVHPKGYRAFLRRLYELLLKVEADWDALRDKVAHVGKAGDAHQILLDVVGLSPGSVEYYQLYAESFEQLYNSLNLEGLGGELVAGLIALGYKQTGMDLLAHLGYGGAESPEILDKFFLGDPNKLKGEIVQAGALSETEVLRACTPLNKNYIEWLVDAARTSLETIRAQKGFKDDKAPTALLYIMLRHAITLGYWDASLRLHQMAQLFTADAVRQARIEPKFIQIGPGGAAGAGESRWSVLYKAEPVITGQAGMTVADFIPLALGQVPATRYLHEQLEALDRLKDAPTARLERAFAEHIDCASYRLDAWKLGLVGYRLATMRYDGAGVPQPGIYLGMYGWLEQVRPEHKVLEPVGLEGELAAIFAGPQDPPLTRDRSNAGFIHAPSLNHAVTAAVLRNGYLANASPGTPGALSVNLSSERVRRALGVLEGIRNGQSLAALLGYLFERGLHDSHNLAEVDEFIYKLRKAFPLAADHFKTTETDDDVPVEAIEARNVVDGLALLNHVKKTGDWSYPFGVSLPPASAAQRAAIEAEVARLADLNDAVSDLAMAEGVHQVVLGNYDRAAATADAYSKATFPPSPEVVQTPRSGIGLTHRVALHLEPGRAANASPIGGLPVTRRAFAEPALNAWLASVLPNPTQVGCHVAYVDAATGAAVDGTVTQAQLGLQPIDLLYMLNPESQAAMTALDDAILHYLFAQAAPPRLDSPISVGYTERGPGLIPLFEVAALVRSLRSLLGRSRPLRPGDLTLQEEATSKAEKDLYVDPARLAGPRAGVDAPKTALETLVNALTPLLADSVANHEAIIGRVDADTDSYITHAQSAAAYGIPQAGIGFAYEWRRTAVTSLLSKAATLVDRWQEKLDDFDDLMAQYAALPAGATDDERFALLQEAENRISTQLTIPLPATPALFEPVVANRRAAFVAAKAPFDVLVSASPVSVFGLLNALRALPVDPYDPVGLDVSDDEAAMVRFAGDLAARAASLAQELGKRSAAADTEGAACGATSDLEKQTAARIREAKALFGDDFVLVPEFGLSAEVADELEKALADTPALLHHLTAVAGVDFPVDDWLYGAARVREKLHLWENITFLTEAFGAAAPALQPAQLPFVAGAPWLALPFPDGTVIDGERLLYTAHYSTPFNKGTRQCGLLLDEWSEVIPVPEETTGVAFHYDRPSTEPPQVMLLVVPPEITGHWRWADLVDALHETLDMAVHRAIEPDHVGELPYARFLPATLMAVTVSPITIIANLAWNNLVFQALEGTHHE